MAKRVRRGAKGRFVKSHARSNPSRKRRRSSKRKRAAVVVVNPRHAMNSHRRRRHHRRNPDLIGSIGGGALHGITHGATVVAGQVVARKLKGATQGILPSSMNVSSGMAGVATSAVAALGVTVAHALLTPAKYKTLGAFVVAGAWSEAINQALAQTPIAPYLAAYPRPALRIVTPVRGGRIAAYPRAALSAGAPAFAAYPRTVGLPANAGM